MNLKWLKYLVVICCIVFRTAAHRSGSLAIDLKTKKLCLSYANEPTSWH